MVLYGVVTNTFDRLSVLGGIGPGLFMALVMMLVVAVRRASRIFRTAQAYAAGSDRGHPRRRSHSALAAILLGGIYSGAVTPLKRLPWPPLWRCCWPCSGTDAVAEEAVRGAARVLEVDFNRGDYHRRRRGDELHCRREQLPEALGTWIASLHMSRQCSCSR